METIIGTTIGIHAPIPYQAPDRITIKRLDGAFSLKIPGALWGFGGLGFINPIEFRECSVFGVQCRRSIVPTVCA